MSERQLMYMRLVMSLRVVHMSYQSTLVTHGCGIELELVVGLMVVFVTLTLTQVYHFISC